jgi:hypothetical protein
VADPGIDCTVLVRKDGHIQARSEAEQAPQAGMTGMA